MSDDLAGWLLAGGSVQIQHIQHDRGWGGRPPMRGGDLLTGEYNGTVGISARRS